MVLASRKMQEIRSTLYAEITLQTCGGLINGSTVEDQWMPRYGYLSPTFHLTGRDV